MTGCVTDGDIQTEVSHAISAAGWTTGPNKMFFVFTPSNVGSCYDSTSDVCAYTQYCAYHSLFVDSGSAVVLYTNQPYTDSAAIGAPGACDSGSIRTTIGPTQQSTSSAMSISRRSPIRTAPAGMTRAGTRWRTSAPGRSARRSARRRPGPTTRRSGPARTTCNGSGATPRAPASSPTATSRPR